MKTTSPVCPTCKRPIIDGFCSEFCAECSDKEKEEFRNAREGDFVFYPCPDCGCVMEDCWYKDPRQTRCSNCAQKAKQDALKACAAVLKSIPLKSLPADVAAKVKEALKTARKEDAF